MYTNDDIISKSTIADFHTMPIIKTPQDLAAVIRSRRKQLGWDQATLARQVGVSRQWVIDVEKGKPRAELELILRSLNALGLSLTSTAPEASTTRSAVSAPGLRPGRIRQGKSHSDTSSAPRYATTKESNTSAAAWLAELSRSPPNSVAAAILRSSSALWETDRLAPPRQPKSAAEILSAGALQAAIRPTQRPQPRSAAEVLRGPGTLQPATQLTKRPRPQSAAQLLAATSPRMSATRETAPLTPSEGKAGSTTSPTASQPRKPKDEKSKTTTKKSASKKTAAFDSNAKKVKKR